MPIHMRAYAGVGDQQRMAELAQTFPDGNLHVIDLPYRLSSWAFDHPENIGLWEDENRQLLAWTVLQTPFWAIDYAMHPIAFQQGILREMLAWASSRAQQIRAQPNGRPMWFVHVRADQSTYMHELEHAGFRSIEQDPDDPWSGLYLERLGRQTAPDATLPAGFTIRPLAGQQEVAAYVTLHQTVFGSPNMTIDWRTQTLQRPEYVADLDLVVEGPDGQLVAFCVCWTAATDHGTALTGQIEPLGVHPDFQKLGLGRAVLLEDVRRMQDRGVAQMIVETDDYRDAAVALYQAAGFEVTQKIIIYRKDVIAAE